MNHCQLPSPGETIAIVDLLRSSLPALQAVYLFGSQATGQSTPGSDIDVAVLTETPLSPRQRFELAAELGSLLGQDVDLIDLRAAYTVLRSQVVGHGAALYRRDPEQ